MALTESELIALLAANPGDGGDGIYLQLLQDCDYGAAGAWVKVSRSVAIHLLVNRPDTFSTNMRGG
jgi:hypothetical protein